MTHEGLDEGLITRLREKYAHMSRNAQKSNPDEDGTCKVRSSEHPECHSRALFVDDISCYRAPVQPVGQACQH